jgi:antagonist of KipI
MDVYSHASANRLVGNRESAAALEITLIGPELRVEGDVTCAVTGASFALSVDGAPVQTNEPFTIRSGAVLRFGPRTAGARATLAVRGGFHVEASFGSRATSLISRMGPFGGRALRAGDVLPVGSEVDRSGASLGSAPLRIELPRGGARLRVMSGPHSATFARSAYDALFNGRFIVTTQSNRMGYRLEGPVLAHAGRADILSDATPIGSIQVPASGQPILLMADRQTTGGYPKIATVITADLPLAGQLGPGDWIEFAPCSRRDAIEALRRQHARLEGRAA